MVESTATSRRTGMAWQTAFWLAQIVLAVLFGLAGAMKTFMTPDALVHMNINYATEIPIWLLRFIGICELAGAIGVMLPALTRIQPQLTPLAALGFAVIQVLAIGFHFWRGELAEMAPINLALLGISLFVIWGRVSKSPIGAR